MTAIKSKPSLTEGPIFIRMFLYALPIMLTGIFQLLYNIADNIIVGQFSGNPLALAAVGSTSSLGNLIVNLLMGIAGGAGVVIAQSYGAKEFDKLSRAVHTAVIFSLVGGVFFSVIGFIFTRPALVLMGTKSEIMEWACLYLHIICLGIPASAVYNFGAAILRSVGDSKTPLYILSSSGIINVLLNIFFVIVCDMSVDGVAIATIIAQYISAITVTLVLFRRSDSPYALNFAKMRVDFALLKRILRLGLPAGIQGSLFSISNIILTSGINTLPTTDISAKTIAINIEGIVYSAMNSYLHTSMTFTGQNFGAKKPERIKKSILFAVLQVAIIGIVGGQLILFFGREIASLYISPSDPNKEAVLAAAMKLMKFMLSTYFLCGVMDALSGSLRGLGYSLTPMLMSIGCICVLRSLWVFFIFPLPRFNSLVGIYTIYPISWLSAALLMVIALIFAMRKINKKFKEEEQAAPKSE